MSALATRVLTLREYESARIGDRWDPEERIIPPRAVAALERLQEGSLADRVLEISRRHVRALNFVGTICVDGHALDVLPKIDQADRQARSNLLAMLQVAGLVPTVPTGVASQGDVDISFLEMLLRVYIENLTMEWRRGHASGFLRIERNRPHLRGKLRLAEHIRTNLRTPWRLYTGADEFVEDVALSRLLKAALRTACGQATTERTRQAGVQLLAEFEDVSDNGPTRDEQTRLRVDRQSARFAPLAELAKMILRSRTPDHIGVQATYSLVFDMNVVFERLVGNLILKHASPLGTNVRLQFGGRALLLEGTKGRFWLRPDIGIFRGAQAVCLIDTKWKRLDPSKPYNGVSQGDMYQMYAYGKEHQAPVVIALYPRSADLGAEVVVYRHQPGDITAPRIAIATVDVGVPPLTDVGQRASVRNQLREILSRVAGVSSGPAPVAQLA